jgi:hypothetical protein
MKTKRLGLLIILAGLFLITTNSCKKCKGEDPQARIINNGTSVASVQIKTSEGNTVNLNNVDPGTSSPFVSYAAGEVTFTISANKVVYVETVQMGDCYDYDITINANNTVTTNPIDRNN